MLVLKYFDFGTICTYQGGSIIQKHACTHARSRMHSHFSNNDPHLFVPYKIQKNIFKIQKYTLKPTLVPSMVAIKIHFVMYRIVKGHYEYEIYGCKFF